MYKCAECGKKFERKMALCGHKATHTRKTGVEDKKKKVRKEYYKSPKKCLQCNCILDYENKRHKFCNHSCAAIYNNKGSIIDKYCKLCNKKIVKNNKGYNKYCSQHCCNKYRKKDRIKKWKSGETSGTTKAGASSFIKRYFIEKYGDKCTECGWNKVNKITNKIPVTLHHKDGDPYNNKEDNLILLCPNCHSLTPNYKALNKGKGRPYRRKM